MFFFGLSTTNIKMMTNHAILDDAATLKTHSIGCLLRHAIDSYIDDDEHFVNVSRIYSPELSQEVIHIVVGGYTYLFEMHRHVIAESYVIQTKDGHVDIMSLKTGIRKRVTTTDTCREIAGMIMG